MRILLVFGFMVATVIVACGNDYTATGPVQGDADGACFANNTCNAGLSCDLVGGSGKCVTTSDAGSSSSSTSSSGTLPPDGAAPPPVDGGTDAAPAGCTFTPTPFPCAGGATACYTATQTCALTGCADPDALRWACNSPDRCNDGPCCLPKETATVITMGSCQAGLLLNGGTTAGAGCTSLATCGEGIQLCQTSDECPIGRRCVPTKIAGDSAPASMSGLVFGVCAP